MEEGIRGRGQCTFCQEDGGAVTLAHAHPPLATTRGPHGGECFPREDAEVCQLESRTSKLAVRRAV